MILFDNIKKIGYTDEEVEQLINDNKIVLLSNNTYKIKTINFFVEVIDKLYPNYDSLFEDKVLDENNITRLKDLFRLVHLRQNLLAQEFAFRLSKNIDIYELHLIVGYIDVKTSNIKYIYSDDKTRSHVSKYKLIERKLLLDFLCWDVESAIKNLTDLCFYFSFQSPLPFTLIKNYVKAYDRLRKDKFLINSRDYRIYKGNLAVVINNLLMHDDFLAASKMLREYYLKYEELEFTINYEIYRILDRLIMKELHANYITVNDEMNIKANGYYSMDEIIKSYDISSISCKEADRLDYKVDYTLDSNIDYFEEYKNNMDNYKYQDALVSLIKYQKSMKGSNEHHNIYYLMNELNIILKDQEINTEDNKLKHNALMDSAKEAHANNKYADAVRLYEECLSFETTPYPSTYSKIGECYMALNDYKSASLAYQEEHKTFIGPMDYIHLIRCLYYIKDYSKIIELADELDYYYINNSGLVHYILSIVYVEKEMYDKAMSEIETCEILFMEEYELALSFHYEKNIISKKEAGKMIDMYKLEDYQNHCFDKQVIDRVYNLDVDNTPMDGSLLIKVLNDTQDEIIEDKLYYLENLYKILMGMERTSDANDVLDYIHKLMDISNASESEINNFTAIIKKL